MPADTASPLFIVGPQRSGSTLLRLMVGHHPDIHIFGEFDYVTELCFDGRWPEMEHCRWWLANDRMFQDDALTLDRSLDFPALAHDLLSQHAARTDKPRVGASCHANIDALPRLWPDARFVHILRDPRDVARSNIGMGWAGHVYFGVNNWIKVERQWDRLCEQVAPERRIEVRFEDLLSEPEAHLRGVCELMGLPYDNAMLDYADQTTYDRPDPKLAYQWKRKLKPRDVGLVEARCGELLTRRGYERSGHPNHAPGTVERARLWAVNRWVRTRFVVQRYGLSLVLQRAMVKRMPFGKLRARVQAKVNEVNRRHLK